MQALSTEQRSEIIEDYAKRLLDNVKPILEANKLDMDLAKQNSMLLVLHTFSIVFSLKRIVHCAFFSLHNQTQN